MFDVLKQVLIFNKIVTGIAQMKDGKPIIGELQGQALATASHSAEKTPTDTYSPDPRRRRLIRGAVGIAPMVITLRSGSLAAASCTGVKALGATANDGTFTASYTAPSAPTIAVGDNCVAGYTQNNCASPTIDNAANSTAIGGGTLSGDGSSGDPYKCSNITGIHPNVAIVSMGVTSFA